MKLKQKPEDFVVTESWRFDKVAKGEYRVYVMDKQKVSTFDAIGRIADLFGLPRSAFSFCGLKDKQGRTTQLIAVKGVDVDMQDEDLRLKYLGRSKEQLTAANTTSNRFGVTVRDLTDAEVAQLPGSLAEVNRMGVVNYFDSQRFGSLKHGQGFIAKELLRGDFEMALKNYLAKPSPLDRTNDAKVKAFWRDHWGEWKRRCTIPGAERYERILAVLRAHPNAYREAFLRIDAKQRAMLVFTYQSWLWNESVRRLLMSILAGQSLLPLSYQAGKLLFPREATGEVMARLRDQTVPLVAPDTTFRDPDVEKAVKWVLGREKLTLEQLEVPNTPEIFFRHEERPVLVFPGKLMTGPARPDEVNRGMNKVYVAFTLPPGSYATLVVRRLFHFTQQSNEAAEDIPEVEVKGEKGEWSQAGKQGAAPVREPKPKHAARKARAAGLPVPVREERKHEPSTPKPGFRATQKAKKEQKAQARGQQQGRERK